MFPTFNYITFHLTETKVFFLLALFSNIYQAAPLQIHHLGALRWHGYVWSLQCSAVLSKPVQDAQKLEELEDCMQRSPEGRAEDEGWEMTVYTQPPQGRTGSVTKYRAKNGKPGEKYRSAKLGWKPARRVKGNNYKLCWGVWPIFVNQENLGAWMSDYVKVIEWDCHIL